jgi:Flp pilus assembly protein TadB
VEKSWQIYGSVSLLGMGLIVVVAAFGVVPWLVPPLWIGLCAVVGAILLAATLSRAVALRFAKRSAKPS